MANALYQLWKQELMKATANTDVAAGSTGTNGTYAALVHGASYTFSQAHQFYSSIVTSPDAVIGTDQEITAKTQVNGTLDGNDLTYTAVANTNGSIDDIIVYRKNSGANSTWALVAFFDTSITGLPVTPNGGNITVTWNASGIFTLSDAEAKENIFQLDRIGPVGVYAYNYRGEKRRRLGLVAQEVEAAMPQAVRLGRDGLRRVNYEQVLDRMAA